MIPTATKGQARLNRLPREWLTSKPNANRLEPWFLGRCTAKSYPGQSEATSCLDRVPHAFGSPSENLPSARATVLWAEAFHSPGFSLQLRRNSRPQPTKQQLSRK